MKLIKQLVVFASIWLFTTGLSLKLPKVSEKNCLEQGNYEDCYHASYLYQISSMQKEESQFALRGCELELNRVCENSEAIQRKNTFLKKLATKKAKQDAKSLEQDPNKGVPQHILLKEENCFKSQPIKDCSTAGAYFRYLSSPLNIKRALKIYQHGCQAGDAGSCSSLQLEKKGINRVYDVEVE